jgi:predicted DNA-binding protein (MmcQ/YjbR family)
MGRNKIYKNGRTQIAVFLEDQELEIFDQIMWREKQTRAQLAHKAIEEYMKNHAEGNSTFKLDQFQDPNFRAVPTIHANREKWISHYKDSNREDRVKLNIKINDLQKVFKMIEVNENRK